MKQRPSISVNFTLKSGRDVKSNSAASPEPPRFSTTPGERPQEINIGHLVNRPKLTRSIANYIRLTNAKSAPATRIKTLYKFRYFYEFLDSWENLFGQKIVSSDQIDQRLMDAYADWLDGKKSVGSEMNISGSTKNQRYNEIKRFVLWHCGDGTATDSDGKPLRFQVPWPENTYEPQPQKLSMLEVSQVFKACREVIAESTERIEYGLSVVKDPSIITPPLQGCSTTPYRDFRIKLKSGYKAMKINYLSGRFREEMPGLARALRQPYGTVEEIVDHLYMTTDSLIPYMILVALPTCFNEVGLISLRWSNIQEREGLLGGKRIYLKAEKSRSGYPQNRSFAVDDDPFSIGNLLAKIKKTTALTHELCTVRYEDIVFLPFHRRGGGPRPLWNGTNVDSAVTRALSKFRARFDLPQFTLNDLRTIGGDIAAQMSQGDLIIQQIVQQHRTSATTNKHYTTTREFLDRQERLAHTLNERERIISSKGKVDTRNQGGRTRLYSAATPGFDCDAPHDSPIHGQQKGRLCSAYGKCFACPFSSVIPSPRSAARLLQFEEEFKGASDKMNSARWIAEWQEQQDALLEFWLLQFPADLLAAADVRALPPIVPIE